jgi:hypothetical protein
MSFHLSTFISTALTGRISVKLYIGDFYENPSRKTKFGYNLAKISDNSHEDLSRFTVAGDIKSPQKRCLRSGIRLIG